MKKQTNKQKGILQEDSASNQLSLTLTRNQTPEPLRRYTSQKSWLLTSQLM